jgi:hypothetical protein
MPLDKPRDPARAMAAHSPLGEHGITTAGAIPMKHLRCDRSTLEELPAHAFAWATGQRAPYGSYDLPALIFADKFENQLRANTNDFMIGMPFWKDATSVSSTLLEVLAHKRSRLFGFRLADRFVNVMLPPAVLRPTCPGAEARCWFMQPLVSFIRGEYARLRGTYTLSFFLVPVASWHKLEPRTVTNQDIRRMTNAGWGYAASRQPDSARLLTLCGPLLNYLSGLARFDLGKMERKSMIYRLCVIRGPFTLRQVVERVAFGVGLAVGQGRQGLAGLRVMRLIGNDVIMALGSARVSAVTVVDPTLETYEVRAPISDLRPFPKGLSSLMATLSSPIRDSEFGEKNARKNRLDRPFFDDDIYAAGVIPTRRCLVVVSNRDSQYGSRESALMQAGSVAYMTLGAAAAIGTMREINRRLEYIGDEDPKKIAKIDGEIAADLNEIYDLDITRESYREMYRRLRIRLGIARDYKILQDKMQALYRATSTLHEHKAERRLEWLTAAIVALSVFILIGTIVLIGKGG